MLKNMRRKLKNMRRKVANAISPEKTQSYPLYEVKWATAESWNKKALIRAHEKFDEVHGRPAIDDAEAWKWDREQLNESLRELGLEEASTEFIPEHFYEVVEND